MQSCAGHVSYIAFRSRHSVHGTTETPVSHGGSTAGLETARCEARGLLLRARRFLRYQYPYALNVKILVDGKVDDAWQGRSQLCFVSQTRSRTETQAIDSTIVEFVLAIEPGFGRSIETLEKSISQSHVVSMTTFRVAPHPGSTCRHGSGVHLPSAVPTHQLQPCLLEVFLSV